MSDNPEFHPKSGAVAGYRSPLYSVFSWAIIILVLFLSNLATAADDGSVRGDTKPSSSQEEFKELKELDNTPAGGTLPGGTVPGGTVPGGTLPGGTLPGGTLPGGTVPGGTVPGGTLPGGPL